MTNRENLLRFEHMGEAKRRGSFEQRKAESIETAAALKIELEKFAAKCEQEAKELYDSLTPEQKEIYDKEAARYAAKRNSFNLLGAGSYF